MPVLLRCSGSLPKNHAFEYWLAVTGTAAELPADRHLPDLSRRLQTGFDGIRDAWLELAYRIGKSTRGALTDTATGAAYINDFGLMLAWTELVRDLAAGTERTLVVCDDPWMFRHLATLADVDDGKPPALWPVALRLYLRGFAARLWLGRRLVHAASALRSARRVAQPGGPAIVVYGHPHSDANGNDAYFGPLMKELPNLGRALHTDCGVAMARELCRDGRSFSLHGWGNPLFAVGVVFVRWRPARDFLRSSEHWLLRRAAAYENSGGALATTRWQAHCQARWISAMKPAVIAWPWENHPWERDIARVAQRFGVSSIGYQHAVIGRHQFNFSPASNPDGEQSLPDKIMCNGPAYRDQLVELGHDPAHLEIGGAFRVGRESRAFSDPAGPVYVALSSITTISRQMLDAVSVDDLAGISFVVKDHPLYPIAVTETGNLKRTPLTIPESGGLRAVLYSTGTTGLEGLLAGVPTYRFLPADRIAPDILPDGVSVSERTKTEIVDALTAPELSQSIEWANIMAPVDINLWRSALAR
jgi:hypothetical protein